MRANQYLRWALLSIVLPLLWIISAAIILISMGIIETFTDYVYALYESSQRMIIMGIFVGGLIAVFGSQHTYKECRKMSMFEWPSEQAKRQAAEEFWSGVGYVCTFLFVLVIVVLVDYWFSAQTLTIAIINTIVGVAIYAVATVVIGTITLGTSLLIELIFGKY